ncbi:MAG: RNA polymerase sigma factor [Bacillota bacterium]
MSDESLLRAVQQGDRGAAEELVRRYHRQLLAFYYRLSLDYHLAQDLAQECLLRLISRAALYRYPEPLKPWLYRIATNIWRDHRKSAAHRRAQEVVPLEAAVDEPEEGPSPQEVALGHLEAQEALANLARLPSSFAEVLLLRFCQELTVPEIAAVLHLPEGTVKSRIFHGLRHLRARMAEEVNPLGEPAELP